MKKEWIGYMLMVTLVICWAVLAFRKPPVSPEVEEAKRKLHAFEVYIQRTEDAVSHIRRKELKEAATMLGQAIDDAKKSGVLPFLLGADRHPSLGENLYYALLGQLGEDPKQKSFHEELVRLYPGFDQAYAERELRYRSEPAPKSM